MSKELVKKQKTELSTLMLDLMADAGAGMENTDGDSYAIPFLQVLQGLSPQLETVDGAKPGLLINSITQEMYKEAQVIPCAYVRRFLCWAPRSEGGGYRGDYSPIDVETGKLEGLQRVQGKLIIEGDELKDTRNHFVLVKSEKSGGWQPALMSLTSTQIKKSKRWMSLIKGIEMRTPEGRLFTPPSFSHVYKVTTQKEENNLGSWYGLVITVDGPVQDKEVYAKAKELHQSVSRGEVQTQEPQSESAEKF